MQALGGLRSSCPLVLQPFIGSRVSERAPKEDGTLLGHMTERLTVSSGNPKP